MRRMTNFRSAAIATGNAINDSAYDNVKIVADNIVAISSIDTALADGALDDATAVSTEPLKQAILDVADMADDIPVVVGASLNIGIVGNDLNSLEIDGLTPKPNGSSIANVGINIANINILADEVASGGLQTVADATTDISLLADNIDGTTSTDIPDVADNLANITSVSGNIGNVGIVATNITSVNSVAADKITIDSVFADKTTLDSIHEDKATLDSLYADKTTLDSLYTDKDTLDSLYTDKVTIDRLYTSIDNVDTTVTNIANIDIVANDLALEASSVINGVSENIIAVTNVSANIADVTNYADRNYGPFASDPVTRNDLTAMVEGDEYFNTTINKVKAYTGSVWVEIAPTITSSVDVKTLYESNTNTNAYTDLEKLKLSLIDEVDLVNAPAGVLPVLDGSNLTVTKAQVGLSDVDNTNDLDKPISTATQTAINLKANQSTTYTQDDINTFLEDKADKDTTYTYEQINALNNTQDLENFLNFKF